MSAVPAIPAHIAIVMDGNGRWAKKRNRPRSNGHQAGLKALRTTIENCMRRGVGTLSVFAFSSENWKRPANEVARLMDLFLRALDKEVAELHDNEICLRFVGDKTPFRGTLRKKMAEAEALTANNRRMVLNVAVNYGGRWDITQAARRLSQAVAANELRAEDIDEACFARYLAADAPDPDLFIRTGGEMRISNFLLWQSAYAEFWFTPVLWPDFDAAALDQAIDAFQSRERRFGHTSEQVRAGSSA
jgi:undecaprenyl diphosphate synthase